MRSLAYECIIKKQIRFHCQCITFNTILYCFIKYIPYKNLILEDSDRLLSVSVKTTVLQCFNTVNNLQYLKLDFCEKYSLCNNIQN